MSKYDSHFCTGASLFVASLVLGSLITAKGYPTKHRRWWRAGRKPNETGKRNILVTGGAGYIGSHTVLLLLQSGYSVTVIDNMINSSEASLDRVRKLSNCQPSDLVLYKVDLRDAVALKEALADAPDFDACIHFAGLKAVGESVREPILYYENNILSTLNLLKELQLTRCRKFVFSSSATVYGTTPAPITEDAPVGQGITNPYGQTKFMIEEILKDFQRSPAGQEWSIDCLRYFNPVGAHPSGEIGEDPSGTPNNLMPYVAQVAVGRRPYLTVFGNDYPTKDGTGVRDYLHVMDLGDGHIKALQYLDRSGPGWYVHNLGTGKGYSVLDMVKAMEKASGREIAYKFGPRRPGDLATVYADPAKAKRELQWEATKGLEEMARDLWAWQSKNPNGYRLTAK